MAGRPRTYRMSARADAQAATRLRITESAVALHGSIGPAQTTMSAVAAHAGVRRSTLYRHFPDEASLFDACSSHWSAANPPPDASAWAAVGDPDARLRAALGELYAYYGRTEAMLANLLRDERSSDLVRERLAVYRLYIDYARGELMRGRALRGASRTRTAAALGHVLAFSTWRSLSVEQGLSAEEAAALMVALVRVAQQPRTRASRAVRGAT